MKKLNLTNQKMIFYHSWMVYILILFTILTVCTASEGEMTILKNEEGYQFYEDGSPILFYRTVPLTTAKGTHSRANYCHPVIGLDGETLTEDFPKDHLHHRGIFWAWHQVYIKDQLIRDMWECTDFIWDIHDVKINNQKKNEISLHAKVNWKSLQWKNGNEAIAEESLTIRLYKTDQEVRMIDFEIQIAAKVAGLRIGGSADDKGYGGFSTRIPLPDDLDMKDKNGVVVPDRVAIPAGDWINFSGTFAENKSDIAVMIHPSHPGKIRKWILRKKGSCQNVAYPGREPVSIDMEKPLTLKYRVVIHKNADLNEIFTIYSAE